MKFFILLTILSLALAVDAKRIKKIKCGPVSADPPCPAGMVWALGDTPECDTTICRGAAPYCQDPPVQVFDCRCSDPNTKKDGFSCVEQCPLYPSAPPGGEAGGTEDFGPGGREGANPDTYPRSGSDDMYPNGPEAPEPICPAGMTWEEGPTLDCDNNVCHGDPVPQYCEFSTETSMSCRCINGHYDYGICVENCPLYPQESPDEEYPKPPYSPEGPVGPDMYPSDPEVLESICPVGQQLKLVPIWECDMNRCRGDPPPGYCEFSTETVMACRCISGHYDYGTCVGECPLYPQAPPPPPPGQEDAHGSEGPGGREGPDVFPSQPDCGIPLNPQYDPPAPQWEVAETMAPMPVDVDDEMGYWPMPIDPILVDPMPVDSICPAGMTWEEGPTWDCDNAVCRGAMPVCQDEAARVLDCFCTDKSQSKDGSGCVSHCPLYESAPPRKGSEDNDDVMYA